MMPQGFYPVTSPHNTNSSNNKEVGPNNGHQQRQRWPQTSTTTATTSSGSTEAVRRSSLAPSYLKRCADGVFLLQHGRVDHRLGHHNLRFWVELYDDDGAAGSSNAITGEQTHAKADTAEETTHQTGSRDVTGHSNEIGSSKINL